MKLRDLLAGIESVSPAAIQDAEISSVAYDSRKVTPGAMFVAIHGEKTDGNLFVSDAIARGARVICSEQIAPADLPENVGWVEVTEGRKALSTISANFYKRPAEKLKLTGVTGTNGKTTTVFLVDSVLRAAGVSSGMFGTIRYRTPKGFQAAEHTTPESLDLQSFLSEVRNAGGTHATLEASSHALALDRLWGCPFAVAVFTNLTRDHLDYHKTMDAYFAAKRHLFSGTGAGAPQCGVVNADDPHGKQLLGLAQHTITYGLQNGADIITKKFTLSFSGLEFTAQSPAGKIEIRSPLVGRINVYNILAAIGASLGLGIKREAIEAGIAALDHVPGRFARIDAGQPFLVVVDYAHTDDALRNLIQTARDLLKTGGRIITLFGCGGDRDRTKRPLMGEAAGSLSDMVVLTSDNPRSEDPLRIINDAVVGLQKADAKYVVEPDRERAIAIAMEEAREGDIVLLAGKGHETSQVLKDRTIDFNDHEMARVALRKRGYTKSMKV